MRSVVVKVGDLCEWAEVREVVEWKEGAVYKTRFLGYAKWGRPREENEVYSSLSTKLTRGDGTRILAPVLGGC